MGRGQTYLYIYTHGPEGRVGEEEKYIIIFVRTVGRVFKDLGLNKCVGIFCICLCEYIIFTKLSSLYWETKHLKWKSPQDLYAYKYKFP